MEVWRMWGCKGVAGGDWKKRREGILWSRCNNITKGKYFKITTKFQNYKLNYSKKDDFFLEFIFHKLE